MEIFNFLIEHYYYSGPLIILIILFFISNSRKGGKKIDPEYLEAYYFRGILAFSMERRHGSSIDARACKDIKKAYKNNS